MLVGDGSGNEDFRAVAVACCGGEAVGCDDNDDPHWTVCTLPGRERGGEAHWGSPHNGAFIVRAHEALPRAIAEIRRLRAELNSYKAQETESGS